MIKYNHLILNIDINSSLISASGYKAIASSKPISHCLKKLSTSPDIFLKRFLWLFIESSSSKPSSSSSDPLLCWSSILLLVDPVVVQSASNTKVFSCVFLKNNVISSSLLSSKIQFSRNIAIKFLIYLSLIVLIHLPTPCSNFAGDITGYPLIIALIVGTSHHSLALLTVTTRSNSCHSNIFFTSDCSIFKEEYLSSFVVLVHLTALIPWDWQYLVIISACSISPQKYTPGAYHSFSSLNWLYSCTNASCKYLPSSKTNLTAFLLKKACVIFCNDSSSFRYKFAFPTLSILGATRSHSLNPLANVTLIIIFVPSLTLFCKRSGVAVSLIFNFLILVKVSISCNTSSSSPKSSSKILLSWFSFSWSLTSSDNQNVSISLMISSSTSCLSINDKIK